MAYPESNASFQALTTLGTFFGSDIRIQQIAGDIGT